MGLWSFVLDFCKNNFQYKLFHCYSLAAFKKVIEKIFNLEIMLWWFTYAHGARCQHCFS
jgi:hypothetical protein